MTDSGDGNTALTPDVQAQLIPTWMGTRAALNQVEQENKGAATRWAYGRRWKPRDILDDLALRRLHARMLGSVWQWAGQYSSTERNIGVVPWQVGPSVRNLVDDARAWVLDNSAAKWHADRVAIEFHHRLVLIHPFPNGNGRHARLVADVIARARGEPPFSWGRGRLEAAGNSRDRYIAALRQAAAGDIGPLLDFGRS